MKPPPERASASLFPLVRHLSISDLRPLDALQEQHNMRQQRKCCQTTNKVRDVTEV